MEPRARIGKNRGQQAFTDQELSHFLFAHGDTQPFQESTKRVLDELLTDFITEVCFEAHRSAQLAGRQKIKIDDIRFACRKNPQYLGKIEEMVKKREDIDKARKMVDVTDDKVMKTSAKGLVEELNDADDDPDLEVDAKSTGTRAGK